MVCPQCQSVIDDENAACPKCGWSSQKEQLQQPAPAKKKLRKEQKSKLKKILIPIVAVLALGLIILIGRSISDKIYYESDEYKTSRATELVLESGYAEALKILTDVNTPEATAIKDFVKVEYARKEFTGSAYWIYSKSQLDTCEQAYYDFIDALDTFKKESQPYCLPEALRQNYNRYKTALDYSVNCISDEVYQTLCDKQTIYLNDLYYETGETFTINELQNRWDITSNASSNSFSASYFKITDSDVINTCFTTQGEIHGNSTTVTENGSFGKAYNNMLTSISLTELKYKIKIEDLLKKFSPDDRIYDTNPSSDSTQYADEDDIVDDVHSIEDIYANADRLKRLLRIDITYYLIVGSATY